VIKPIRHVRNKFHWIEMDVIEKRLVMLLIVLTRETSDPLEPDDFSRNRHTISPEI
jgi:hypothetical protein